MMRKTIEVDLCDIKAMMDSLDHAIQVCWDVDNDPDDIDSSYPFATGYSRATMQDIKQTLAQYYKPLYLVK